MSNTKPSNRILSFIVMGLACVIITSGANAEWYSKVEAIMGTEVRIELWHENPAFANASIDMVIEEMHRIDRLMSTYKASSELSQVNRLASDDEVLVSDELFELLQHALKLGDITSGAFDITYASVGQYYDYRQELQPSDEQRANSLALIDASQVQLDTYSRSVRFSQPGVRIDLGGIAKGYAVERAIELLKQRGIRHAIVSAGGDSRILGDRRGRPWAVGIRDPRNRKGLIARLPVQDEAVSTSGDYERFFESRGERIHHIISPSSGKSASTVRSVTIIGPNAVMTDALSTGVFVLGADKGLALINSMEQFEAVIIDAAGAMHFSRGLEPGA